MITLKTFVFNPFQENTYILFDETKEGVIIDPGFSNAKELEQLLLYIDAQQIKVVHLINTHGHIDHILGIAQLATHFNLAPGFHIDETEMLGKAEQQGAMFGMSLNKLPEITNFLSEEIDIKFGITTLQVLHVPGHSKGSVAFYSKNDEMVITGDVLFKGSIGRTDLPGGNYDVLMNSIFQKLMVLDDNTKIFPGHGPFSTIGIERKTNPFINNY